MRWTAGQDVAAGFALGRTREAISYGEIDVSLAQVTRESSRGAGPLNS